MATERPDAPLLREELARVLSSAAFSRGDRVSKLLRFLVERHIEGRDDELKETLIGVEVFGRRPDYDPKLDSTVRTEAVRLRSRLNQYYSSEGTRSPLVIEVPKGGYVPRCRPREVVGARRSGATPLWVGVGLIALVVTAAAGVRWALNPGAPIPIAVLPLVDLSEAPGNDSFVDGLTDEVIRQVSGVSGLAVRSRTSSFALKGGPHTIRDAARQLDVDYIVEGSVTRSGAQARITAQLVRVRDDVTLWTGTFERRVRDVLALQREIARGFVNAVQLTLRRGPRSYDTEAFDLYLRGRDAADSVRFSGDDEVIGLFEQAIRKAPSIAPAHAGLAVAYAFQSFQVPIDPHRAQKLDRMRAAAERAIRLDPQLADAHNALGAVYALTGQWGLAEQSFRRAIEIDPDLSTTRRTFARFLLLPLGRMDEAVREARTAAGNDPLSLVAQRELADVLLSAGRYDEAAQHCERLSPQMVSPSQCLGRARLAQGRVDEAIQIMTSSDTGNWGYLAYAYAKAGRREKAEALVAAASTRYPNRLGPFQYALVSAGLADKDMAIEQLRRMSDVGPVRMGFTLNSPEFAFVRDDPRVKSLRKDVGLPE